MEKVQAHIQSCGIVARTSESSFFEGTMTKQLEARFPNGSVIYGLPANPDTARGYTGNVTLDEFAFHQDATKVFSALYPTITRGYQLEVVSTPNGQQGKFFEIAKAAGLTSSGEWKVVSDKQALTPNPSSSGEWRVVSGKQELTPNPSSSGEWRVVSGKQELTPNHLPPITSSWSGHRVDIYQAVAQGFQIDIEGLRAGCDDEETWLQEYCCEFLSDAQNYIPMELIMGCVSEQATTDYPLEELLGKELYLGVDIGRKRDLTVAWLFEKAGDVLWSRVLLAFKGMRFDDQEKAISDLLELEPRRCAIDQSGLGMMLAERLAKKYG